MKNKKILIIIGVIAIVVIGAIVGGNAFIKHQRLTNTNELKKQFVGEWIAKDNKNLHLIVENKIATFKNYAEDGITYEDCSYELNNKYVFALKGVNANYECQMKSSYQEIECRNDKDKIILIKEK